MEYDVLKSNKTTSNDSIETKKNYATISPGGYLIYGVAHQHSGGIGATVYGQVILFLQPSFTFVVDAVV